MCLVLSGKLVCLSRSVRKRALAGFGQRWSSLFSVGTTVHQCIPGRYVTIHRPEPLLDPVRLGNRAHEHVVSLSLRHRLQDRSSIRWSVKVTQACILIEASPFSMVLLSLKVPFPRQGPMATGNLRSGTLSSKPFLLHFPTTHRVPQLPRFNTEPHLLQVILFLVVVA